MEFVGHYLSFRCTPVRSRAFSMHQIGLLQKLFANCVNSCAFAMDSNWPLLDIIHTRVFSMARIDLCQTFSPPVSTLCPNCRVFMENFLNLKLTLVRR